MRKAGLIAAIFLANAGIMLAGASPQPASVSKDKPLTLAMAPQQGARRTLVVPAQTEADIQLLSGIHSQVSHVGDPVTAQLLEPVYVDGQVALPAGTLIDGSVTRVRSAGRMRRGGEMVVRFERVTLPDGQNTPLSAILTDLDAPPKTNTRLDAEGFLKGTRTMPWKRLAGGMAGLGAFSLIGAQLAGAAALGASLPVGGGALIGYSFLWNKGNEVHVPPDTQMKIRLRNALTIRVAW